VAVTVTGLPEHTVAELTATVGVVLTVIVAVLTLAQFPLVPVTVYTVVTEGDGAIVAVAAPVFQV
jgi:hypothetical protein